jgi:Protein of unknown function (DUF3108)
MRRLLSLAVLVLAPAVAARGQASAPRPVPPVDSTGPGKPDSWPFAVGEKMVFEGKWGPIPVGRAELDLDGRDTLRGHQTFRARFSVNGGPAWFGVHDNYTSWFDTKSLISYLYFQDIHEGNYRRLRTYEIYPSLGYYVLNRTDTNPTVANPLDDQSFIYFIRTLPLAVGQHYEWNRYFQPAGNPVIVDVVRMDTVNVAAGRFVCFVLRPTIRTKGIFGQGGHAEVWISDDDRRLVVQMKSGLSFGSLSLYLKSYTPGNPDPDPPPADTAAGGTR